MSSEPVWFTALVDQRVAAATDVAKHTDANIIFMYLKEAPEGADLDRWDLTCDGCGKYAGEELVPVHVARDIGLKQLFIVGGVCSDCRWEDDHVPPF